jgi:hypothetical protein
MLVKAYASVEVEGGTLWLSRDDMLHMNVANSVSLYGPIYHGANKTGWVTVKGRFHAADPAARSYSHMDVTWIDFLPEGGFQDPKEDDPKKTDSD